MRHDGAVGPRNGELVTNSEAVDNNNDAGDGEGEENAWGDSFGCYKSKQSRLGILSKVHVDVVNVKAKLNESIRVVSIEKANDILQLQQQRPQQQQQQVAQFNTKLIQNSLTTTNSTGSTITSHHSRNHNRNQINYSHNKENTDNNSTTNKAYSLIDEIFLGKLKENPIVKTRTTTARMSVINEEKVGNSKGLATLIWLIVTDFAAMKSAIMRILHVPTSFGAARSSTSNMTATAAILSQPKWSVMSAAVMMALLFLLLPCGGVHGDEIETTTPEFDYASRGDKKFGDKCENTLECGFPGSICDPKKKSCQCPEDLPVTNHIDKCGKEAAVNESCFFNEQCEVKLFQTECRDGKCICRFEMSPFWNKDGTVECKGRQEKRTTETYIDPAMIGVLVGMALMFIIICVVLRLFSQARWHENRTIFNTPNPRLMNVSLLRDSKLIHGQERRGSRMSMRGPSRQPSMASLRPHSPNPSGSHSNSHGSNASATSLRSTRSNSVAPVINANSGHPERHGSAFYQHQHHDKNVDQNPAHVTNITTNPVAESVTVEIMTPDNK